MTDRPPTESLAQILTIEAASADRYNATLESFWGETVRGDLIARAVLVATDGSAAEPAAVHAAVRDALRTPKLSRSSIREISEAIALLAPKG